jgi:hypothetical protein
MAKYLYDVNTTTRYIDIHKQFRGGLKTVDTDDALKDVYLREAENVSLSEFNFVEKRYGLHSLNEHAPWDGDTPNIDSIVQGYFEYYVDANTVHKIIVIEGNFYVDQGSGFAKVEFFTIPTGTKFIDLSPLGIYTEDVVNTITTGSAFGTQVPRFLTSAPVSGTTVGVVGQVYYAFSNDTYYVCVTDTTTWNTLSTQTDSYPASFTSGEFYYDTRTQSTYRWNNATGTVGVMTVNESFYRADIQTTRPIEGVRLDNRLYIATGTYPVYYEGDGKIYVFPHYEMSDLDIAGVNGAALGYNLNSLDLEEDLTNSPLAEDTDQNNTGALNLIVKDTVFLPRLPFSGGDLQFQISYTLGNNSTYTYYDTNFTSVGGITTTSGGSYGTVSSFPFTVSPDKANWVLKPVVSRRPATIGGEYTEVPENELEYITLTNDENTDVTSRADFDLLPLTSSNPISNMVVTVKDITAGFWDYKVVLSLIRTGFTPTFSVTTTPTVQTQTFVRATSEFLNLWITAEELTNYKEEPFDSLKVHTCNRITEHNGRLCLFGSTTHPDYLFFSTISAKEYFPYSYSLQFTNDLQEPITAVNKFMNILVVQSPSYTFGIKGDSPFPLSPVEGEIYRKISINPTIGCIAPHSVKNVRNQLYFLSKEGIFTLRALFAEDLRYNVDPIDRNIYNIVPRDTDAVSAYFDDQYWLHFPQSGETLRYYVDKKSWVKDTYAAWYIFGGIHKYINESGKLRFITELSQFESEEGSPIQIFDVEIDYSLPTDLTKNIVSKITTSYLNQDYPFHPKNYKEAKLDFAIQNEYNTSLSKLTIANYADTNNYVQFTVDLIDRHFYSITFIPTEIGTRPAAYTVEIDSVQVASGNITQTGDNLSTIRFMSNKSGNVTVKITITGKVNNGALPDDGSTIKLYDSTYDHTVTFNTMILSEEGTLNIDPIENYTSADVAVPVELGTQMGNWTFGTSNFGSVIVAVKTVKLSGRGYNSKVSIIEDSKSKWTLESLGITYKMKKARSR